MQQSQNDKQSAPITHSIQTVFLVVVESLLTLLLRFDNQLRRCAYPLATEGSLIAIRSYLPHDEIYLTFTFKGVLIDSQMPEHKQRADVIVNAHSFEIVNAMLSDKAETVDKLQIRGEDKQVALFKDFLYQLSISAFVHKSTQKFLKKKPDNKQKEQTQEEVAENETDYKFEYTELKKRHHLLKNENKRLKAQSGELQSRQKFFTILAVVALVIGVVIGLLL